MTAPNNLDSHQSDAPAVDALINEHLGRPVASSPTYDADMAAIERVRDVERELNRIRRMSTTGTVENWLMLPDADKRLTFALAVEESARRKEAEVEVERLRDELRQHARAELEALQKASQLERELAEAKRERQKCCDLNDYAESRVIALSGALHELARWKLRDGDCWCDGGEEHHSPGCKAARAVMGPK
jgi:hypothetical protein